MRNGYKLGERDKKQEQGYYFIYYIKLLGFLGSLFGILVKIHKVAQGNFLSFACP